MSMLVFKSTGPADRGGYQDDLAKATELAAGHPEFKNRRLKCKTYRRGKQLRREFWLVPIKSEPVVPGPGEGKSKTARMRRAAAAKNKA